MITVQRKFPYLLMITAALLATMLACNFPGSSAAPKDTPIPVSSEAVVQMETQVVQAVATVQAGGPIVLEMTEQQLTSAAVLELQNQSEQQFRDVQIRLRDGLVIISGTTTQSGLDLPVSVKVRLSVTVEGRPRSVIEEAAVGPFDLPDTIVSKISTQVEQTMFSQLGGSFDTMVIDSIVIADGKMTVTAHQR